MEIIEFLTASVKSGSSDLHISAGVQPKIRVDGDLQNLDYPALTEDSAKKIITDILTDAQKKELETKLEIDFAYYVPGLARFRVNVFNQNRGLSAAFRTIPDRVLTLQELNMPKVFEDIADLPNGLVLVTGPTGSGKSTTLAAMIDHINEKNPYHIVTIEDPIEFVHQSKKSLINQREVYRDTLSFDAALRSVLREDPDIILVGEMRDLETIRLALTAAETGHLVFATLHTISAAKTISRIIDVFPGEEKALIRTILSESLQAVVCQALLKKVGGGRVAALEVMMCTPAIRNLIREDKTAQMYSAIQTGVGLGMTTLDQHLRELVNENVITRATAREVAMSKDSFS